MVIVEKALGVLLVKPGCEIQLRNTWYVDIENDAGFKNPPGCCELR